MKYEEITVYQVIEMLNQKDENIYFEKTGLNKLSHYNLDLSKINEYKWFMKVVGDK